MKNKVDKVEPRGIPKEIQEKVETKDTTELVFILDKSGSMAGMEKDVIGGFNAMIEKQKVLSGKAYVSTVLFSTYSEVVHDRVDLEEVPPMTDENYQVGGGTALLDAIGGAIKHIANVHKYVRKEDVPSKTIFVITTDGMENASRKYHSRQIKEMIRLHEEDFGWEFLFVASNIDAVETAENIGIRRERAANYDAKTQTRAFFDTVSMSLRDFRTSGSISESWAKDLENELGKDDKSDK